MSIIQLTADMTDQEKRAVQNSNNNMLNYGVDYAAPIGATFIWPFATAPATFLLMNGALYNRADYPALWAKASATAITDAAWATDKGKFSHGNGTTTFRVPDWAEVVTVGYKAGSTEFGTLGKIFGEKTHQLTVAELPKHSFNVPASGGTGGGFLETLYRGGSSTPDNQVATNTVGGDQAHNNIQPSVAVNYIIKAVATADEILISEPTVIDNKIAAHDASVTAHPDIRATLEAIGNPDSPALENLVKNGDFSDGTTGWTGSGAVLSASDNTLTITGNGSSASPFAIGTYSAIPVGHKILLKIKARSRSSLCTQIRARVASGFTNKITIDNPVLDQWYEISVVYATTTNDGLLLTAVYSSAENSNGQSVEFQYVLISDLIAFGTNTPTAAQMDILMSYFPNSWFDGKADIVPLLKYLIAEKAGKTQEAWITPTLVNSWVTSATSPAKYMKDSAGNVRLSGSVTTGTVGATAFTLPAGYRPSQTANFAVVSNNVFGYVAILTDGQVKINAGSNAWISFDNIAFRVA